MRTILVLTLTALLFSQKAMAQSDAEAAELAKKLSNPVAALISVPFQYNFDDGAGPVGDGNQHKFVVQPVIPISLNDDWNLISRTIVPYIQQDDIFGTSSQNGLSDTVQSFFFSPKAPTSGGWIWGVGPVLLLPTASDDLLGTEKWGTGPTAVVLKQEGGWTYGALANHIWSFAGEDSRSDVNATFIQPFLSFTTQKQTTFVINSESTYDWENEQWSAPINVMANQLFKVGSRLMQAGVGVRYYADGPDDGPDWGLRLNFTLLFPK